MSWRDFKFQVGEENKESALDPFQVSGAAVRVFFPALNRDIWLCADEKTRTMVERDGLPCLLFTDLEFILQGKPGEDRLNRLINVCARRHPVAEETLKLFNGKITKINTKGLHYELDNCLVSGQESASILPEVRV